MASGPTPLTASTLREPKLDVESCSPVESAEWLVLAQLLLTKPPRGRIKASDSPSSDLRSQWCQRGEPRMPWGLSRNLRWDQPCHWAGGGGGGTQEQEAMDAMGKGLQGATSRDKTEKGPDSCHCSQGNSAGPSLLACELLVTPCSQTHSSTTTLLLRPGPWKSGGDRS